MNCLKKLTEVADAELSKIDNGSKTVFLSPTVNDRGLGNIQAPPFSKSWTQAISMAQIQNRYKNASIENCTMLPNGVIEIGKRWIKSNNKPSLYLFGNTGSGKTYFSTALYRALVEEGNPWVIYVKSSDLDEELLNAIEEKQEKTKLQKYCEVPFLFIDDLGVERPSDRIIRQYFNIIDKRVGDELVTVITSNASRENLLMGDRIISRLQHFTAIEFPKKDLRKHL